MLVLRSPCSCRNQHTDESQRDPQNIPCCVQGTIFLSVHFEYHIQFIDQYTTPKVEGWRRATWFLGVWEECGQIGVGRRSTSRYIVDCVRQKLERARARFSGDYINEACTIRERGWKTRGWERSREGAAQIGDQGENRRRVCVCLCVFACVCKHVIC